MIKIEIDNTYKIRQTGGKFTFGTVTEENDDGTYSWKSDHPDANTTFWARESQFVTQVRDGTYLGDDGRPPYKDSKEKEPMRAEQICFCDETEHEICYDGLLGCFDPTCECCKQTLKACENSDSLAIFGVGRKNR